MFFIPLVTFRQYLYPPKKQCNCRAHTMTGKRND